MHGGVLFYYAKLFIQILIRNLNCHVRCRKTIMESMLDIVRESGTINVKLTCHSV